MNYCSECGAKLPEKAKFCPQCGHNVSAAVEAVAPVIPAAADMMATPDSDSLTVPQKRMLSGAVLVALTVAVAYYYLGFIAPLDAKTVQHTADDGHNHDHPEQQTVAQQPQLPVPSADDIQRVKDELSSDPSNTDLQLQLGNMLFDSQRFREAIQYYSTVLETDPNNADVRVDLGVSHYNLQEFKVAEEQFKLALKGQPDHLNALYNMGIVSLKLGEVNQLISYWGQLIEKAPESGQAQQAKAYLEELHQEIEQFPKVNEQTES